MVHKSSRKRMLQQWQVIAQAEDATSPLMSHDADSLHHKHRKTKFQLERKDVLTGSNKAIVLDYATNQRQQQRQRGGKHLPKQRVLNSWIET